MLYRLIRTNWTTDTINIGLFYRVRKINNLCGSKVKCLENNNFKEIHVLMFCISDCAPYNLKNAAIRPKWNKIIFQRWLTQRSFWMDDLKAA